MIVFPVLIPVQNFLFPGTGRENLKCHGKGRDGKFEACIPGNHGKREFPLTPALKTKNVLYFLSKSWDNHEFQIFHYCVSYHIIILLGHEKISNLCLVCGFRLRKSRLWSVDSNILDYRGFYVFRKTGKLDSVLQRPISFCVGCDEQSMQLLRKI